MHPDLRTLIELQQTDSKVAELTRQIGDLPAQIKQKEAELSEFLRHHEEHKARLAANQKERKELDTDIQTIRAKISKHRDQLYEVKTNEQYRAMLKEIEGEEARISKIEDKILEKMVEAENLQSLVQDAAARLDSEKARVGAETRRLESEKQSLTGECAGLEKQRQGLADSLDSSLLATYERVRRGRAGMAVAEVREGICSGCNVRLRPQMYNDVRHNESIVYCESCARILYYLPPPPDQEEAAEDGGTRVTMS